MVLNWKVKLTKNKTQSFGNNTGNSYDDLDNIATVLGITKDQCYDQITNIRIKKVDVWSDHSINAVQFTYTIDTKDKTGVEVLGYKHGGANGTLQSWDFSGEWRLMRMNGKTADYSSQSYYNIVRWLQFKSFCISGTYGAYDFWAGEKGTNTGSEFNMIAPVCFFSRGGNLLYAFGCYQGEIYDSDLKTANDNLTIANNNLNTWASAFGKDKTAEQIKKEWETGNTATTELSKWTNAFKDFNTPELLQAEITRLTNNQEKHTDYDKIKGEWESWTNIFPKPLTPEQVKAKYDEQKESHTDADLKPKDLPEDWSQQLADLKKWTSAFPASKFKDGAESVSAAITNLEGNKTSIDNLTTYWNNNISKDYDLPKFSMEALTELHKNLKVVSDMLENAQEVKKWWWQNKYEKYGDKVTKESLNKIKTEIDNLNQLAQDNTDLTSEWNTDFLKDFNSKPLNVESLKEVKKKLDELNKKERSRVKDELVKFYQKLGIDDDPIKGKYGEDFFPILDKKINLDNEEEAKRAFKVVACICATEGFIELDKGYQGTDYRPEKLRVIYRAIMEGWKEVEKYQSISEKDNPLYLEIVREEWKKYKASAENLSSKYVREKLTRAIKIESNDLDLLSKKTIYHQVFKEKTQEAAKNYLDWLKQEYQSAGEAIDKLWNDRVVKEGWGQYSSNTGEESSRLQFMLYFTDDKTVVEKVRGEGKGKLDKLFLSDSSDDDITKSLKSQPTKGLLTDLGVYKADEVAFTVELFQDYYFGLLPKYIKAGLGEKLTLNDLDQAKWKEVRQNFFTHLHNAWEKTTHKEYLDNLKNALDKDILDLDELIKKTEKTAENDLKAAKEKYKQERVDGKAWLLPLTKAEKNKIDQADSKQELEKVVRGIMAEQDKFNPNDLAQANKWVQDNILNKTKLEDLPTEAGAKSALDYSKLPPGFEEKVKQILRERSNELTPEPTTSLGKIKKLLKDFKEEIEDLEKERGEELVIKVFKKYWKAKVDKIMPLVDEALATDTLEGYKLLDEKWLKLKNQELKEANDNYNHKFDYLGVWNTLRSHLEEGVQESEYNDLVDKARSELGATSWERFSEAYELKIEVKKD